MKLIATKCAIKYDGKWYFPKVPFTLDCKEIPNDLVGFVEEYVDENVEEKETKNNQKDDGLLIKNEEKPKTPSRKRKPRTQKVVKEENLIDDLLDLGDL